MCNDNGALGIKKPKFWKALNVPPEYNCFLTPLESTMFFTEKDKRCLEVWLC